MEGRCDNMKKNISTPTTNDLLSTEDLVMMSCDDVQKYMAKQKEKYLSMHTAPITQGKGSDNGGQPAYPIRTSLTAAGLSASPRKRT